MKKSFLLAIIVLTAGFFFCQNTSAQDLVYRPKNPNFGGGDTFMFQQLLSQADSQNDFQEEGPSAFGDRDEVDQFTQNLNQQLLNQISRELLQNTFGDDIIQEGTFQFGTLSLEIFPSSEGLVINILDTETGSTSQIIIPN